MNALNNLNQSPRIDTNNLSRLQPVRLERRYDLDCGSWKPTKAYRTFDRRRYRQSPVGNSFGLDFGKPRSKEAHVMACIGQASPSFLGQVSAWRDGPIAQAVQFSVDPRRHRSFHRKPRLSFHHRLHPVFTTAHHSFHHRRLRSFHRRRLHSFNRGLASFSPQFSPGIAAISHSIHGIRPGMVATFLTAGLASSVTAGFAQFSPQASPQFHHRPRLSFTRLIFTTGSPQFSHRLAQFSPRPRLSFHRRLL